MSRLLVLAFVLLLPLGARAGTISYSGFSVISPQTVTLGGDALGGKSETVSAGEITLSAISGGTGSLATFCVDVADWLQPAGSFKIGSYLDATLTDAVNALISHVLPTFGTETKASAALQVAIWKKEYGKSLSVTGNDAVTDLAQTYLNNLDSGNWRADRTLQVVTLDGAGVTQSQAYLAKVPEPGSLALVGAGLLGVAALGRRLRLT